MKRTLFLSVLLAGISAGAASAQTCPAPRFEVTDLKVGDGALDKGWIGGISLADVDADGDLDIYATRGYDTSPARPAVRTPDRSVLYLNDGKGAFSHADTVLSNADGYASGATFGDVDSDGDLDAFVSTQINQADLFYRNLGRGEFRREDMPEITTTPGSNFTSSWADIDGDGDLDLYSGGPTLARPGNSLAFRNDGDRFTRITPTPIENGLSNGAAALWGDLDNDGDSDLVAVNSDIARLSNLTPAENEYTIIFRNDGDWSFTRITGQPFEQAFPSSAGALGDVDADGDLDLFLGLYVIGAPSSATDRLFRNNGAAEFTEITSFQTEAHSGFAGGAAFADFDLDGDLDLLSTTYDAGLQLQLNDGSGGFTDARDPVLLARSSTHATVAVGDLDGDGDLDGVVGNWGNAPGGEYATLVINHSVPCGAWTELVLLSDAGAPNPPGARVTLVTQGADGAVHRNLREAAAQTTFRGQSGSSFLFALPASERVLRAELRWPDGRTRTLAQVTINGRETVSPPPPRTE